MDYNSLKEKDYYDLYKNKDKDFLKYLLKLNDKILNLIDKLDLLCICHDNECNIEIRFSCKELANLIDENNIFKELKCDYISLMTSNENEEIVNEENIYISYGLANALGYYNSINNERYKRTKENPIIEEIFKFITINIIKINK